MTVDRNRVFAALASPLDPRDYVHEPDLAAALPARFTQGGLGPVLDQGSTPECTCYSAVGVRQWHEKRDGHGVVAFDPGALYALVKGLEDAWYGYHFDGAFLRDVLRVLKGSGTPLEDGTRDGKIASYYRVYDNVEQYKRAILVAPLYFRIDWASNWWTTLASGVLRAPTGTVGGHAVYLWGWDDNVAGGSFLLRNSWGAWGTNGNAYLPYRYVWARNPEGWLAFDVIGD